IVLKVINSNNNCESDTHHFVVNQTMLIENHCINIKPNHKFGIDNPNKAININATSENEYCLTEEIIPTIKPKNTLKTVLYTVNSRVTRNLGPNSEITGKLVFHELPKSN